MRTPLSDLSTERLLDVYGAYLRARLTAHPESAPLVHTLADASSALVAANERQREALATLQDALSSRDYAALVTDRMLTQFRLAVLSHVNSDRSDRLYARYFPKSSLGPQAQMSPAWLVARINRLTAYLEDDGSPEALKPWASRLTEQRIALEKTMSVAGVADDTHANAQLAEVMQRSTWLGSYRGIYGDLIKLFPADRKKVESFFRPGPKQFRRAEVSPTEETKIMSPSTQKEESAA